MAWDNTTGVYDFVRSPEPDGAKVAYFAIEIDYVSSARVFTDSDLTNYNTTAVMTGAGTTLTIDKGTDGDPVFGFVEEISEDGAVANVLVIGMTEEVNYAAAAEDPDVSNSVLSKGDGTVKQTPTAAAVAAGGQTDGRGIVVYKDTTNTRCKLWFP